MAQGKNLYTVGGILIAIAILFAYYKFNPAGYGFFPKCPFHTLTGLDCPGCGSQRAIHSLLHGELKQAMGYNLLLVASLPLLAVQSGYKLFSFAQKKEVQWRLLYHPFTPKIIFVVVTLFWVLRNIPVSPFNYLLAGH